MSEQDIELLREFGYLCEDPDCEASHVDVASIPEVTFVEDPDLLFDTEVGTGMTCKIVEGQ